MKWISRISGLVLLFMLSVATHDCMGMDSRAETNQSRDEVERAAVGDINIAYRVLGQGDPIVLIMGYSSTMDMWDPLFLDSLSSKYRVIIFDNRGMGNTTAPPGNFSIAQVANDTAGLLTALGIEKYHVLGWSMGVEPDLYQIWHSSQSGPHQLNFIGYRNPEADELIVRIRREYDFERRVELCHRLHAIIARDQPYTFLYVGKWTAVLDRRIVLRAPDGSYRPITPTRTGSYMFDFNRWIKLAEPPRFDKQ